MQIWFVLYDDTLCAPCYSAEKERLPHAALGSTRNPAHVLLGENTGMRREFCRLHSCSVTQWDQDFLLLWLICAFLISWAKYQEAEWLLRLTHFQDLLMSHSVEVSAKGGITPQAGICTLLSHPKAKIADPSVILSDFSKFQSMAAIVSNPSMPESCCEWVSQHLKCFSSLIASPC